MDGGSIPPRSHARLRARQAGHRQPLACRPREQMRGILDRLTNKVIVRRLGISCSARLVLGTSLERQRSLIMRGIATVTRLPVNLIWPAWLCARWQSCSDTASFGRYRGIWTSRSTSGFGRGPVRRYSRGGTDAAASREKSRDCADRLVIEKRQLKRGEVAEPG
jgi:hypothetical protein